MIYTSYFAKLKTLPEYIIPISICGIVIMGNKSSLEACKDILQQYGLLNEYIEFQVQNFIETSDIYIIQKRDLIPKIEFINNT